jgi:GT2 family glycosyltransferase/glycosyltransferase involved in cell wall biosynthesis
MDAVSDLHVVVVAFHGAALLDTCLRSLAAAAPVIVVDNSSDRDVETVARAHGADYVDAGANRGFAAGVNIGIKRTPAGSDVLLLNPDAELTGDGLRALHAHLRARGQEHVAALSPALVDPTTGRRQRVRWPFPSPAQMWWEAFGLGRLRRSSSGFCVGAVLLLRAEALAEIGPLDERFFLYAEETDWQRRAVVVGWQTVELTSVTAAHEGAGTSTDLNRREVLFHAGTETYIRKWHGRGGWASYRLAAVLGAGVRGALLRGSRGQGARTRASLYLRGPRSVADLPDRVAAAGRRVVHVVVTNAFAGVERYVSEVARQQTDCGSVVTVIGGDPSRMPAEVSPARHIPAADVPTAVRELIRLGRQDVVHAHMTAAEAACAAATPWHRAPIVATRHFAGPRGSSLLPRVLGRVVRGRLAQQIAISRFVAESIGEPAVVLPNGVRSRDGGSPKRHPVVLCMQRLETEKATDVALRAWAASGLDSRGWRMQIAGSGSQRVALEALVAELGVASTVDFLGQVIDTGTLLRQASLVVATATAEPFGLSIAEAMATGTPVLASDGGAHPELLGSDGWLFPAGDVARAADRLRALAELPDDQRTAYGLRLQQRQRELFALTAHVRMLDGVYAALAPARA